MTTTLIILTAIAIYTIHGIFKPKGEGEEVE